MKTKDTKYLEATERNVKRLKINKYLGKPLDFVKQSIGIRPEDTFFDAELIQKTNAEASE